MTYLSDDLGFVSLDKAAPRPEQGGILSHAWGPQLAANLDQMRNALVPPLQTPGVNNGHYTDEPPQWNGLVLSTAEPDINGQGYIQVNQVVYWGAHCYFDELEADTSLAVMASRPPLISVVPVIVGNVLIQSGGSSYWHGVAIAEAGVITFWGEGERLDLATVGGSSGWITTTGSYMCAPPTDERKLLDRSQ